MNVTGDYIFKAVGDFSALCGHDVTSALIFIAVTQSVTRHLRARGAQHGDLEGAFFKDSLRQPTSALAVAEAIGASPDTVRRKTTMLAARGLMKKTPRGGLLVDTQILTRPDVLAVVLRQRSNAEVLTYQLGKLPSSIPNARVAPTGDRVVDLSRQRLTRREQEVLALLLEGQTAKEAARRLKLSPRTVENFRYNIIRKMGVKNIAALAARLLRLGEAPATLNEVLLKA